jgi:hypothetical protein
MEDKTLTAEEAFRAMFYFLEEYWSRTQSDGVAALLGDLRILLDGGPADPAAWPDFVKAIMKARENKIVIPDSKPSKI